MAAQIVFYSWQSDLPNATNRGFIERCLRDALDAIKADPVLTLAPRLDRDTSGVSGSPDIAATIFEKIAAADVVVVDVSFVDDASTAADTRRFPNPNVLIELGYAASSRGWNRILCLFNSYYGDIEDLPFDIRHRRIISYSLGANDPKPEARQRLTRRLQRELEGLLKPEDDHKITPQQYLSQQLFRRLSKIIIAGNEIEERNSLGTLRFVQSDFEHGSNELRNIADWDTAEALSLSDRIWSLAEILEELSGFGPQPADFQAYSALVRKAVEEAEAIKKIAVDPQVIPDDILRILDALPSITHDLRSFSDEIQKLFAKRRPDSTRLMEIAVYCLRFGQTLSEISLIDLDAIKPGLASRLGLIGKSLHLLPSPTDHVHLFIDTIQSAAEEMESVLNSLPQTSQVEAGALRPA
jgi:hypothetical protein